MILFEIWAYGAAICLFCWVIGLICGGLITLMEWPLDQDQSRQALFLIFIVPLLCIVWWLVLLVTFFIFMRHILRKAKVPELIGEFFGEIRDARGEIKSITRRKE